MLSPALLPTQTGTRRRLGLSFALQSVFRAHAFGQRPGFAWPAELARLWRVRDQMRELENLGDQAKKAAMPNSLGGAGKGQDEADCVLRDARKTRLLSMRIVKDARHMVSSC